MLITSTEIYRFSIPIEPFAIATGTMYYAQNVFIRMHTASGLAGVGECSAFPMIVGETQATCFEMAKDFAALLRGKNALDISGRMEDLHTFTAFNPTIKSAFNMALYDIAAKAVGQPLYQYLGGNKKPMETDLTISLSDPVSMAEKAAAYKKKGVNVIKIKLGKDAATDIERVKCIREAVGAGTILRVDANQGWDFDAAVQALRGMAPFDIQFCEQPMRACDDLHLPSLKRLSPVPLMADESVFTRHDARRLAAANACSYINIKLAKSGSIEEASAIVAVAEEHGIPCMMGGMLESRLALSAFAHFAAAHENIIFYDMDTCLLGHKADPVVGGVHYNGYLVELGDTPGIGADADDNFLSQCVKAVI